MKYDYEKIGGIIKNERKKLGWSQDKLIDMLGEKGVSIGRNSISAIENGNVGGLNINLLTALCECFNCDIGYLLGEYPLKTRIASDLQELTGFSDLACVNLECVCGAPKEGLLNRDYIKAPIDFIRSQEISRLSNFHFLELLLENRQKDNEGDLGNLETISANAYDFKRFMDEYKIDPHYQRNGVSSLHFANVSKDCAKSALSALLDKINWGLESWKE